MIIMKNKKIAAILVALFTVISVTGCSKKGDAAINTNIPKNENKTEDAKSPDAKGEEQTNKASNTQSLDGLTLTVSAKIQPVKGDRTKDNIGDVKGEYFANGSDIAKASDYNEIVIIVDVKNDTSKVVQIGVHNWGAELQDGYKLTGNTTGNDPDDQVQSKSSGKYELHYAVKKDIKAEKIKLTYLWVKNQEEFKKTINDPNIAKMSALEVREKYKDIFANILLETDIQN